MTAQRSRGFRRVFVDTSAYFATVYPRDRNHQAAVGQARELALASELFTTNYIIAEAHALIFRRLNRAVAATFLSRMRESRTRLVWVTPEDVERAIDIIRRYDDKDFSLTDATSFAVIERLRLDAAFSFDVNFRQYGLAVLPERLSRA